MTKTSKAALSTADAGPLTTDQPTALSTDQLATLTTSDVAALSTADAAKLDMPGLPAQVTLACLYGFFDGNDTFHSWAEGQVVTDPSHIALLIERGAPLAE